MPSDRLVLDNVPVAILLRAVWLYSAVSCRIRLQWCCASDRCTIYRKRPLQNLLSSCIPKPDKMSIDNRLAYSFQSLSFLYMILEYYFLRVFLYDTKEKHQKKRDCLGSAAIAGWAITLHVNPVIIRLISIVPGMLWVIRWIIHWIKMRKKRIIVNLWELHHSRSFLWSAFHSHTTF